MTRSLPFLFAASLMFAPLAAAQSVGEIVDVQNAAWRTPPEAARLDARTLDPIVRNEALETGGDSGLLVKFADGSELTLGENASAVIDEFTYAGPESGSTSVSVAKGVFRWISGAIPEEHVEISTPKAAIGVRGTEIFMLVQADGSAIFVTDQGEISVTSKVNGKQVIVPAGYQVAIGADGLLSDVTEAGEEAIIPPGVPVPGKLLPSRSASAGTKVSDKYQKTADAGGGTQTASLADYLVWEETLDPSRRLNGIGSDIARTRAIADLTETTSALRSGAGRSVRRPMEEDRQNETGDVYDNSDRGSVGTDQ
jgi:hypothetical protein